MTANGTDQRTIPTREGTYGSRVAAVEPGGVEHIPEHERHGRPWELFWTWCSPNLEFATIFLGVIPIAVFGGAFWPTAVALMLGAALGAACVGIPSAWGPRLGVPQLVQARSAFGHRGNWLPAALNTIGAGIGWFAVNSISAAFALGSLAGLSFQTALAIVVVLQSGIACVGHNLVHRFERVVSPYLVVVFALGCGAVLASANFDAAFNPSAPTALVGPVGAFVMAFFVTAAYTVGWAPYAMDYSRYLPRQSDPRSVMLASALGVFVPCAALSISGAALATVAGTSWGPGYSPTDQLVKTLPAWLAPPLLLGIVTGTIGANVLNVYSGAMSFLTLGVPMGGLRMRRAIVALAFLATSWLDSVRPTPATPMSISSC